MAQRRIHRTRQPADQWEPEHVEPPKAAKAEVEPDDIDSILDEIDSVLESNAEEFVKGYVQKGGE